MDGMKHNNFVGPKARVLENSRSLRCHFFFGAKSVRSFFHFSTLQLSRERTLHQAHKKFKQKQEASVIVSFFAQRYKAKGRKKKEERKNTKRSDVRTSDNERVLARTLWQKPMVENRQKVSLTRTWVRPTVRGWTRACLWSCYVCFVRLSRWQLIICTCKLLSSIFLFVGTSPTTPSTRTHVPLTIMWEDVRACRHSLFGDNNASGVSARCLFGLPPIK